MKKSSALISRLFLLLAYTFIFCFELVAQPTVTVGVNSGSNNSDTYPTPYGDYRETMRTQYLYRTNEIAATGATAGYITYIGFVVTGDNGIDLIDNLQIHLKSTSITSLDSIFWETPIGDLYFNTATYQAGIGGNVHVLDHPFYWDGVSNILVDICSTPASPNGTHNSVNASVEWSTNLMFKASHTFAADAFPGVCTTNETSDTNTIHSRPRIVLHFSCFPPASLEVESLTSVSAGLGWSPPVGVSGTVNYNLQVGLHGLFVPGGPGALFDIDTKDTSRLLLGLLSSTIYDAYVRTDCGGGVFSDWVPLLNIHTPPGCGDNFFDVGGGPPFGGPYSNNEHTTTTICSNVALQVPTLTFFNFQVNVGDTLSIYNGQNANAPLLGEYSGNTFPPPFTATTAGGCLTVVFNSDSVGTNNGWVAHIDCDTPDSCFQVTGLNLFNLSPSQVSFSWLPIFGAVDYSFKLQTLNGVIDTQGVTSDTVVHLKGLLPATKYEFYVHTNCSGDTTSWVKVAFYTPLDCANAQELDCGSQYPVYSLGGNGIFDLDCGDTSFGRETVFRFTAPNTRNYDLAITFPHVSNYYVNYYIKEALLGCGPNDWNCFGQANSDDDTLTVFLTAGTNYLILFDPQDTFPVSQKFRILDCKPPNDEPWNAIDLFVGTDCSANIYSNADATFNTLLDEPNPDTSSMDGVTGHWISPADETVWFSFTAPASGSVIISTETQIQGSNYDTQLALYSAGNVNDYSTYNLLSSDEDNGNGGFGFNSIVSYSGLNPGQTYYIQVDGYGVVTGTFCISVEEGIIRIDEDECSTAYYGVDVDGTQPGGDHWYTIYTQPDPFDQGAMVSAIKPGMQDLDTVFCKVAIQDTIPVTPYHVAYMPMYFDFNWSNTTTTDPVTVRLFFFNKEFDSLKVAANLPGATINDLNATFYNGTNVDCYYGNNQQVPGSFSVISNVGAQEIGGSGLFYIDFVIPGPGEIGVHLGLLPLPLVLQSFTGKLKASSNLLEWTTQTERNVANHIVERSSDGVNWTELGRKTGQQNSSTLIKYQLEDLQPFPRSYYRLRSVDYDGAEAISKSIILARREAFGIANVFPSPAGEQVTVQFATQTEEDVIIRLVDGMGRMVLEQPWSAGKGLNNAVLSLHALPPGLYTVTLTSGNAVSAPAKMIKQ